MVVAVDPDLVAALSGEHFEPLEARRQPHGLRQQRLGTLPAGRRQVTAAIVKDPERALEVARHPRAPSRDVGVGYQFGGERRVARIGGECHVQPPGELAEPPERAENAGREVTHELDEPLAGERLVPLVGRHELAQPGEVLERPAPAVTLVPREEMQHAQRDGRALGGVVLDGAREQARGQSGPALSGSPSSRARGSRQPPAGGTS